MKRKGLVRIAATTFLVVVSATAVAQRPAPSPQHQDSTTNPSQVLPPIAKRYSRRLPPATVSNTPLLTLAQLEQILEELDALRNGLAAAVSPNLNYESVARHASEIHCRVRRVKENLELTTRHREPGSQTAVVGNRRVEELIEVLGQNIQRLIANPALSQITVVDAELIAKASKDLDLVIRDSKQLRQIALSAIENSPANRTGSKTTKTTKKRSPYLHLTTSCSLFTPDFFLKRASTMRKSSSQIIDGVKVLVKRHTVTAEEPVSLEECWIPNCSATQYEDEHALIVKEFYSHELAGKIFAYAAIYQIARVKDGKLRERFNQTVLLYFVDEEGEGVFKLLESGLPLDEVPGWVTGTGP